jgi:hypothetical protein
MYIYIHTHKCIWLSGGRERGRGKENDGGEDNAKKHICLYMKVAQGNPLKAVAK